MSQEFMKYAVKWNDTKIRYQWNVIQNPGLGCLMLMLMCWSCLRVWTCFIWTGWITASLGPLEFLRDFPSCWTERELRRRGLCPLCRAPPTLVAPVGPRGSADILSSMSFISSFDRAILLCISMWIELDLELAIGENCENYEFISYNTVPRR